jgi:hypothetical protein
MHLFVAKDKRKGYNFVYQGYGDIHHMVEKGMENGEENGT